jgi:hypothetical protein
VAQVATSAKPQPVVDAGGNAVKPRPVLDTARAAPKPLPVLRAGATASAKPQPVADASGVPVKPEPVLDSARAAPKPLPVLRAGATASAKPVIAHYPPPALADLELSLGAKRLDATVEGPESTYLGMVLLSTSPAMRYYLVDLPPMLADAVVMGIGKANDQVLHLSIPWQAGGGFTIYGQAVIFGSEGFLTSGLVVLDGAASK